MNISEMILPTELNNTDKYQRMGDSAFDTEDKVFIYSGGKMSQQKAKNRQVYLTDYAVMCGALCYTSSKKNHKKIGLAWCRTAYSRTDVEDICNVSSFIIAEAECLALCPVMCVKIDDFISLSGLHINENQRDGNITATIGLAFPKSYVGKELSKELDSLKQQASLKKTGAKYTGFMRQDGSFVQNEEYEYNGERYVYTEVKKHDIDSAYEDGTPCHETGNFAWAKVEPITFRIQNWKNLPTSINPNGKGKATFVELQSEWGIISGIPFYPKTENTTGTMWQNSLCRAYLNGYNSHEEIERGNGNKEFKATENFDFNGKGFMYEASQQMMVTMQKQSLDELGIEGLE